MNVPMVGIVADVYATPVQASILNFNGGDGDQNFYDEVAQQVDVPYAGNLEGGCWSSWKKFGRASYRNNNALDSWYYYGMPIPVGDFTVHLFHKTASALCVDGYDVAGQTKIYSSDSGYPDSTARIIIGMEETSTDVFQWLLNIRDRLGNVTEVNYGTVQPDTEYHLAVVATGRKITFYVNGVAQGFIQATIDRPLFGLGFIKLYAGNYISGMSTAYWQYTYVDAFEFTREAKWKTNFTVPTSAPRYEFASQQTMLPYMEMAGSLVSDRTIHASLSIPITIVGSIRANGIYGDYSKSLPVLKLTASGGNYLDQSLPAISVYALGKTNEIGYFNKLIPKLILTATGIIDQYGTLDTSLPAVKLTSSGMSTYGFSLSRYLPAIRISASGITGRVGELSQPLPSLRITTNGYWLSDGTLSLSLPSLLLRGSVAGVITGLCLNVKNSGLTRYDNYSFHDLCKFNDVIIGSNHTGIYLLEGSNDAGTAVEWKINLGKLDLKNNMLRHVWLSGYFQNQIKLVLTAADKDKSAYEYYQDVESEGEQEVRIKTGKGIRGKQSRYYTVEISGNEGSAAIDKIHLFGNSGKER